MKPIKWIFALVLIAGSVFAATGFKGSSAPASLKENIYFSDTLFWYNPASTPMSFDAYLVKDDEVTLTSCPNYGIYECRRGYTRDQLNDPTDPSKGVKSSQIGSPADIIPKNTP
ncbi:MAG TPA: hypothetical protein VF487_18325 [Chitinophagaceae bacterium]